jgi:hypothetical protein
VLKVFTVKPYQAQIENLKRWTGKKKNKRRIEVLFFISSFSHSSSLSLSLSLLLSLFLFISSLFLFFSLGWQLGFGDGGAASNLNWRLAEWIAVLQPATDSNNTGPEVKA